MADFWILDYGNSQDLMEIFENSKTTVDILEVQVSSIGPEDYIFFKFIMANKFSQAL